MDSKTLSIVIKARDEASATIKGVGDVTNKVNDAFVTMAKVAAVAGIAAVGAFTVEAIKNAADYQQSLAVFNSVAGATSDQMKEVAKQAKALGNDITLPGISAKDAADAMTELAKAGISVNDTLEASKGVLSLAKAGQLETAEAALITANALNAFSLKGTEANRVADLLAAGANASSASVQQMAYALQQSSASAAAMKIPVQDLTTLIGEMSNNGISGSDAGTSLKTMFQNLIPTTKAAKKAFKELNLDFFDAQGTFVGIREAIGQLEKGTAKLTDEQRQLAIETIFGSDSSRAANILIKEGVKGYDAMSKAVNKTGAATKLAAAQNSGFNGAMDNLKSTLETLGIELGEKMLPTLTKLLNTVSGQVVPAFNTFRSVLTGTIAAIAPLTPYIAGATAAFFTYTTVMGIAKTATEAYATAQRLLNAVMSANPIGLAIAGVVGLAAVIGVLIASTNTSAAAQDRLNQANDRAKIASDALKASEVELTNARLARQGSDIAVQRAEERLNQLKATGTATALDLKEAEYNLAVAKDTQKQATERETSAINGNTAAKQENKKATDEQRTASEGVAGAVNNAANQYKNLGDQVNAATAAMKKADSSGALKALTGVPGTALNGSLSGKRATGGPVVAGRSYLVGENEPEIFTPTVSGRILNQEQISKQSGNSVSSVVNFYGDITLTTKDSVDAFAKRFSFDKEMGSLGVGV